MWHVSNSLQCSQPAFIYNIASSEPRLAHLIGQRDPRIIPKDSFIASTRVSSPLPNTSALRISLAFALIRFLADLPGLNNGGFHFGQSGLLNYRAFAWSISDRYGDLESRLALSGWHRRDRE